MGVGNEDLFRVDGLVAVITGAGSGLGRMMTHALASNGAARVYIIGRRLDKLEDTAEGYANIVPIQGDATDKDSLAAAAKRIKSEVGYVNVLIANSGSMGPFSGAWPRNGSIAELQEFLWATSQHEMTKTYEVNVIGSFFTMVAFLELLDAGNKQENFPGVQSQVIFTSSIAGFNRFLNTGVAYIPSKAAANHQTKLFSTTLAKWDIRVNAIAPGLYPSEMTASVAGNPAAAAAIPAHRLGSEEDIRGAVLFLTSRAGAYLNGEILVTDGGRLSQLPSTY